MTENKILLLQTNTRQAVGKQVKSLRQQRKIPAVIYGHGLKPENLEVDYLTFERIYNKAGESTLIDLKVNEKEPVKVLIYEIQKDPLTDKIIHADFYQVKMTEKITAEILLKFIGESAAVKGLGGVLIRNLDRIKVECLPGDLVHEIEVDLTPLNNFGEAIHVRDLKIPRDLTVKENPDEVVATVAEPKKEEEIKKELEGKPEEKVEEVKVEGEKKEGAGEEKSEKKEKKK